MDMENDKNRLPESTDKTPEEKEMINRRNFLRGLGKWSLAVIGGVVLGNLAAPPEAQGWVNTRGSWINGPGAGGWANRGVSWINGGGGWINRGGSWVNRGGGSWINRRGW
jgi:hypothetical protein